MRILVTGRAIPTQPDRCTGQQLAEGFRQAGHECVFYGCFYGEQHNFLGVKEVQGADFDLVVVTEMNDGMPGYEALFNYYKLKDVPRIYWDFDVSYHKELSMRRASMIHYDGYLVGNRHFVDEFADRFKSPSLHLAYACSPQIHRRKPEIAKQDLVGFIGSMTSERKAMLGDVNCVEGVFGEGLIDATNRLHTMVHVNQDACKGLVPGRPWETAGCGTNLLMDRASYDDFKLFLPEHLHGEGVKVFESKQDIEGYVNFWESTPQTTRDDALEGFGRRLMDYVHTNHSYKNRAESIVTWVKEQKIL